MRCVVSTGSGESPSAGQNSSAELRSTFGSTTGGVMTEEAGAVTGELELLTRPTPDGTAIAALVRYAGAQDLYTISGSPVRAISEISDQGLDQAEHRAAHERVLEALITPEKTIGGNSQAVTLGCYTGRQSSNTDV